MSDFERADRPFGAKFQNKINRPAENINDKYILKSVHELRDVLIDKDRKILEKNCSIQRQDEVIKDLIFETHQLKEKLVGYRFYSAHPKDEYMIEFGNRSWRKYTFRQCISTRAGKTICRWVLNRAGTKSKKILEFKKYLVDLNFRNVV